MIDVGPSVCDRGSERTPEVASELVACRPEMVQVTRRRRAWVSDMELRVQPLTVRLLGRFEVWRNGSRVAAEEWQGQKVRWLLALLLSQPGHVFSYDALVDALLGQGNPDKARRNLYGLVSRLRHTLQPDLGRPADSAFVLRRGEGYCFNRDAPHSIDTERFDSLVHEGMSLQSEGRWGDAHDRYERAAELYADGFLPENPYDEWTLPVRSNLEERYQQALGGLATCHAKMGDFTSAIRTCSRLIQRHPRTEKSYREQMYFHYCAGDHDGAEKVFQTCVRMLKKDLEVDPSPELVELHKAIQERRAPPIQRWTPNNLPYPITAFVGRVKELAELTTVVREKRLVTLVGMGGIGKTRLAVEVGRNLLDDFPDGVWLTDLGTASDAGETAELLASKVGFTWGAEEAGVDALAEALAPKTALLILDTCEGMISASAELAQRLLHTCPSLHILATSREVLYVPGEVPWAVPPMHVPVNRSNETELLRSDAVKLFLDRASAVAPGFSLAEGNTEAVAALCRGLDGLPLAIELAAIRVRTIPVEELAAQMNAGSMVRAWNARTATARHRTLEGAIAWSFEALSAEEQATFRHAGVFADGFDLEAAHEVLTNGEVQPENVADVLNCLVRKSLLVFDPVPGIERYRQLDTVRAFALGRLSEAGETAGYRARHLNYFVALAERAWAELRGPLQGEWRRRLDAELGNLRTALSWCLTSGEAEQGLRLMTALAEDYWQTGFLRSEALDWLERLLAASCKAPKELRAKALRAHALFLSAHRHRDPEAYRERAAEELMEACRLYEETGDRFMRAKTLLRLGILEMNEGDLNEAEKLFEEVLCIYREFGHQAGEAACLANLGMVRAAADDNTNAISMLEEALVISRRLKEVGKTHAILRSIGRIHEERGDYAKAWQSLEASLALAREAQDERAILKTLMEMGTLGLKECGKHHGDAEAVRQLWEEALKIAEGASQTSDLVWVCVNYARFLCCSERYAEARTVLVRALPLAIDESVDELVRFSLMLLAEIAWFEGNPKVAALLVGATRAIDPDLLNTWHCRRHERVMGLLRDELAEAEIESCLGQGEQTTARDAIRLALDLFS